MMNQRQAVFAAILAVVPEIKGPVTLSKEQKEVVYKTLQEQFLAKQVTYEGELTPENVRKYIPGLVNNWVRKDTRLNGGGKYVPKNPGSRAGSGDQSLKAMRTLLTQTTDADARAEIEQAIKERQAAIAKPKNEVKVDALPEHLRKYAKKAVAAGTETAGEQ
jgi:hypothetical protein